MNLNAETPAITAGCYGSATLMAPVWASNAMQVFGQGLEARDETEDFKDKLNQRRQFQIEQQQTPITPATPMATQNRRIVQVFIADPNENVPLDKAVLYTGSQKLTDLTDTELFFEVPMAQILADHNKARVTFLDKEATKRAGKDVLLDPVKIRDLKMVVVTVAQF